MTEQTPEQTPESTPTAEQAPPEGGEPNEQTPPATGEAEQAPEGEAALGDAGKKALDAMKAKWKAAEEKAKAAATEKARADALQAKLDGKEQEYAEQQKAREVEEKALAKANDRILKAEVRAAAAGKLADPADALLHIDLSEFEVDSDGAVNGEAIAAAIDDLITNKPYLSAQGGQRFQGSADGGARNDSAPAPKQLTEADLGRMSAEQIDTARKEGRLNDLLGVKN